MNAHSKNAPWQRVRDPKNVAEVVSLATEIWNEHFPAIIGQSQVDYMLEKFQSADAIERQMRDEAYEYYLVGQPHMRAGYFAVAPCTGNRSLQLSKLYLRRPARGQNLGRRVIRWLEAECRRRSFRKLWLTVNKDNADSIAFYERAGFKIENATVVDIGGGFVMADYEMVKPIDS